MYSKEFEWIFLSSTFSRSDHRTLLQVVLLLSLSLSFSQVRNLIPIESGHARAAERGENKAHSRSVLKFQEAEREKSTRLLQRYKGSFSPSLSFSRDHYFTWTFREKFDVDRRVRRTDLFTCPYYSRRRQSTVQYTMYIHILCLLFFSQSLFIARYGPSLRKRHLHKRMYMQSLLRIADVTVKYNRCYSIGMQHERKKISLSFFFLMPISYYNRRVMRLWVYKL